MKTKKDTLNQHCDPDRLRQAITLPSQQTASVGPLKQEMEAPRKRGRPPTRFIKVIPRTNEEIERSALEETKTVKNIKIKDPEEKEVTKSISHDEGNGEYVVKCFTIKEGKNEVKIVLKKQSNRMVKMEFTINDIPMKPTTFNGMGAAMNFWNLLQSAIK